VGYRAGYIEKHHAEEDFCQFIPHVYVGILTHSLSQYELQPTFDSLFNEAVQGLIKIGGIITGEDSQSVLHYSGFPPVTFSCFSQGKDVPCP
jgi:hypothetical protein